MSLQTALEGNPAVATTYETGNNTGLDPADGLEDADQNEDDAAQEDAMLAIAPTDPIAKAFAPFDIGPISPRPLVKRQKGYPDSSTWSDPSTTTFVNQADYRNTRRAKFVIDPKIYGPFSLDDTVINFNFYVEEYDAEYGQLMFGNDQVWSATEFNAAIGSIATNKGITDKAAALFSNIPTSAYLGLGSTTGVLDLIKRVTISSRS